MARGNKGRRLRLHDSSLVTDMLFRKRDMSSSACFTVVGDVLRGGWL